LDTGLQSGLDIDRYQGSSHR